MRMKKICVILGSLIIVFGSMTLMAQQNQLQEKNRVRSEVNGNEKTRFQNRLMFRDENGDGICDGYRDHDNDGIPNGQDPDWSKPKDGKGNQGPSGPNDSGNQKGNRNGFRSIHKWSAQSFRQNRIGAGTGVCGKTGSRGGARKGGRSR